MAPETTSSVLDVGCGPHCLPGAVGIDIRAFPGVQHVHNLNVGPWPVPANTFKRIRCQHVIEHVRELEVLVTEMHRVAADGAVIDFITPHYSSYASWGDYTHLHHFSRGSVPQLFEMVLAREIRSRKKRNSFFRIGN